MSIERRQHDGKTIGHDVACDSCSFNDFFEIIDWNELMVEMRGDGWRMQMSSGDGRTKPTLAHYCPVCEGNTTKHVPHEDVSDEELASADSMPF